MFNPNKYKDDVSPEDQQNDNVYVPPPSGANVVVCVGFQRKLGTSKKSGDDWSQIKFKFKIAKALSKSKAALKAEGKIVSPEIWSDWAKETNAKKLAALCIACGVGEEFDPDDDGALAAAIGGIPFGLQHETSQRSYTDRDGNKNTVSNFKMIVAKPLSDEKLVKFAKELKDDPDFEKNFKFEVREEQDNRTSTDDTGANNNDGFYEDDLPF